MNISDIAQKAGVSTATVSRVINNSKRVKPDTREKVLKIIQENDFVPSAIARSLSVQSTSNIGVIFPDIENPFFPAPFTESQRWLSKTTTMCFSLTLMRMC